MLLPGKFEVGCSALRTRRSAHICVRDRFESGHLAWVEIDGKLKKFSALIKLQKDEHRRGNQLVLVPFSLL